MYKDLSLKEKAKVIREGVRLGLNSIDDIQSLYDEAISHKFAEGSIATPDWDPNNPYHYHTANGEKVVITPEDWEKHKGQSYFKQVEDAVSAEQAAHPGPEYIINPKFSEDLRRVYKGNMGPLYQNYSSFSGNLPQGYNFTPEGLVQDNQGNLYVQKGFRQTPRFTYDENNPLVFPVLEGKNQGNVTFYPINMDKTIKSALPVSRIMDVDMEKKKADEDSAIYLAPIMNSDMGAMTGNNHSYYEYLSNEGYEDSGQSIEYNDGRKDVQMLMKRDINPKYQIHKTYLTKKQYNNAIRQMKNDPMVDSDWIIDEFNKGQWIYPNQNEAIIKVGPLQVDDVQTYAQGGPIVTPYDNYIPDNNGYRNDPNVVTGNKYLIQDFEGRGYIPLVGDMNKPIGYFSNAGERGVLYPGEQKNVLGSMVYEHPLIGNLAQEGKKFNKKWKALDNIQYNVYPDTTFTREKTGVGDIEVFDKKNGDTIIYPNGYRYINPYPGQNTIVYNPNTNDAQDVRLDALHLMPQDATYDALNTLYRNNALGSDVYYIANKRYEEDKRRYGKDNIDSFSQYYNNEADALLRNMFIEGTPEYIKAKRYYPNKQQLREWNIDLLPYINEIQEYLETGVRPKYILPEVAVTSDEYKKGGSIHIKPENRGKFTALKKRTGHSASWFKAHGTPAQKKMATFALNSRHWKHQDGGYSDRLNNLNWKMHHSAGSGNIGSVWYNYTFDPENNYYNGTHYVGQNLLGKTQGQLPQGRDHVNLYTYGDETGFERINNATPITVNGETYDYRQYYGNILPFDTIYLKPESQPVVDSMIKHKDLLGINTDYFIMDQNDAETYPKQYKNVFSHRNIKKGTPLDDTRAVSISPKKDENGYYLDAFDVIDYKKTTGFAGNRLDRIVEKENIQNGPYILRQRVPVVFDKNKESNGPLLNQISQYKDNGMTWEEYLMKYSPSYNKTYGRHNQDAVNIEHKRKQGGHLYSEGGFLLAPYLYKE